MENQSQRIASAVITTQLAAGSTASPYYLQVNVTQQLCHSVCTDNTPVFQPKFSVVDVAQVATSQYVATLHCEGIISYVKCGCACAGCSQQPISQDFTIAFTSASAPTSVTIEQAQTTNALSSVACAACSRQFVSETALTLTIA
jgi:hypothetical protein